MNQISKKYLLQKLGCLLYLSLGCGEAQPAEIISHANTRPHIGPQMVAVRPTNLEEAVPAFEEEEVVQSAASSQFRVHYTLDGRNQIPLIDTNQSGMPDYIEEVLEQCEAALATYEELGFKPPLDDEFVSDGNGGDGQFDIYLLDFGGRGDGQFILDECLPETPQSCAGHMLIENDFAGYGYPSIEVATKIVGSHELFHSIQASYAQGQSSLVTEGTAVWASEYFDPSLNDFEGFIRYFLERPQQSIFVQGSGFLYAYGMGLLFRHLEEVYGASIIVSLWEELVCFEYDGPINKRWVLALDRVLARDFDTSFSVAFEAFALWNIYTGNRVHPEYAYAQGDNYPLVNSIQVGLPYADDAVRVFAASARYWWIPSEERTELYRALSTSSDEIDRAEVALSVWVAPIGADGPQNPVRWESNEALSLEGLEGVMVAVINRSLEGESVKLDVCFGSQTDIRSCENTVFSEIVDPPDAAESESDGCNSSRNSSASVILLMLGLSILVKGRTQCSANVGDECSERLLR